MLFLDSVSKMQAQLDGSSQRRAILRPRLLWVLALLTVLAGCSDAQQSGLVTKLKTLLGSETANSTAAAEPDPLRTRENKLNELRKKAEAGDVSAMVELGHAYEDGRSWRSGSGGKFGGIAIEETFVEFDKAAEWYRKAAEQGHAEAQVRLGLLYKKGTGVQKDLAKALEWFEKAAAQGYIDAQYRVGEMYYFGEHKNVAKALEWWQLAAEKGNAAAQNVLGVLYGTGEGVKKDVVKAVDLFQKAAVQGFDQAQFNLGVAYRDGTGVSRDDVKAFEWFQKAAIQGESRAQNEVGRLVSLGEGVPKDDAKAFEWTQKAAAQGEGDAQFRLGMAYVWGNGVAADNVLAYAWSNLAKAKGVENAWNMREMAAGKMSPAEIAEAQRLSSGWKVGMVLARESGTVGGSKQPSSSGSLAKKGTGTLFVVGKSGHAITNKHVTDGCVELRIEGRDGVTKHVTEDAVNDLALVQIPGEVTAVASIASDPAKLRQGEDIVVFGFPLNSVLSSGGNLTPGVVSAVTGFGNNTNQIQITAPIQPGSSGSPVLNKKGEVVGVVSMKLSDSKMAKATGQIGQNVNFAVSGQTLKTFLDAHKVEYRTGGVLSFEKSTADLADEARKWTLVVECWK